MNDVPAETWARVAPELNLAQLDHLERENVKIECLNSSEFVVGKQINFNGPVTIVSSAGEMREKRHERSREEAQRQKVIIKGKVLSQSAAMKVQKLSSEESDDNRNWEMPKGISGFKNKKKTATVFGLVCAGLLLTAASIALLLPTASTEKPLQVRSRCTLLPNNHCIFSEFEWGGPTSRPSKPLQTPVPYVIISQTNKDFCFEINACLNVVKRLQLNADDAACNFFVGSDGNSYEDRGWNWESSLKDPAAGRSLQVCFMGNYSEKEYPTYPQLATAQALIRFGIDSNWISKNYILAASNATFFPAPRIGLGMGKNWVPRKNILNPLPNADGMKNFVEAKMIEENPAEKLAPDCVGPQTKYLEGDVNIQCIYSSEFVVGKQINFNGSVTLINCMGAPEGSPTNKNEPKNEEKVIIRNKVSSRSVPMPGQDDSGDRPNEKIIRKRVLQKLKITLSAAVVCAALVSVTTAFLMIGSPGGEPEGDKIGSHAFFTKAAWGGKPPRSTIEMKLPIPYAVVSHSVTPQCFHLKACALLIKNMQDYHLALDFADIGYNFLVDSNGSIYEGRGWNVRNVKGGFVNGRNIDICLIGDYSTSAHPTEGLMDGLKSLLEFGVESGKLSKNYSLISANATYSTLSPGKNVYLFIKNWPHFDPDPESHVKEYDE